MYNQQHQSRSRKYDYHHGHGSNSSNSDASSHHQQQQTQQQQTTKTMSWTNSSQHKKSTNTVAVTATPTSSHSSGSYNKQSNASNTSSSHTHSTRTYTNQQHHNYQQQQQQNYHYQQPQTRNYGAMKMPSSPISSAPSTMERKTSQSSDAGKGQGPQSTSTASTTAAPHQFQQQQSQQTTTNNDAVQQTTPTAPTVSASSAAATSISNKQHTQHYPPGFATKKHSFSNQGHSGPSTTPNTTAAAVTSSSSSNAVETSSTPAINLAPPVSANTPAAPSTPSWASLFASSSNTSNSASSNTAASATINTSSNSSSSNTNYSKKPIAKVAPYEGITPVTPPPPVVTPGTLSYSAASAQNLPTPSSASTASTTAKKLEQQQQQSQRNSLANLDEFSLKFAQFLTTYKSDWATVSLRPRGLTNRSNYCYINSILQALLGCSPLYNLIRSIPKQAANLCEVKTPTVNAMMTFMSNFSNLPSGLRLRNSKGGKGNKDDLGGDLQCDPAFEPTEIYKLWNDSREEHVEGRQEDAEEFLSYILNKLNDEMLEVIKLISKPNTEQNGQNEPAEEDGDVWQMICNNRNKGSVTRQTDFGCTPLSDIFRGELRSRLQREGEHSTDVIQPFFTLQLNIEKAASVKEALEILVGRDQLEGVTGSKSKQEVVAWQQMNLEKLPPILILHLKWFDYRSDGCTKILKKVEFPVELKIDSKILASKKYSQKQRAYRLFAVVYHDGKEATKGHYITDVYHTGYGSWLRFDDSSVKPVSENHVLLPRTPRVPYLLCYRRCDTIPQQSNNNQNNSSTGNNNTSGNTQSSSGK
ncbi:ubiquitin carboxyl-terminal hydrolase 10 [Lucilia sericata]|uniref:ubiquitin carboxyl-terminal hydrolase 10 n=1 Tax=Lucilia sericata TaxID=13632 RepID=UPI0018A83366|nr:ubiquitin carboxyl-terminal hydrolase 10 [Lucilia sericata]